MLTKGDSVQLSVGNRLLENNLPSERSGIRVASPYSKQYDGTDEGFILNAIGSIIDGLDFCFCTKENRQHVLFGRKRHKK